MHLFEKQPGIKHKNTLKTFKFLSENKNISIIKDECCGFVMFWRSTPLRFADSPKHNEFSAFFLTNEFVSTQIK